MKKLLLISAFILMISIYAVSQTTSTKNNSIFDSSQENNQTKTVQNNNTKNQVQSKALVPLLPDISFDEFPINHNMRIATDGSFYYGPNKGGVGILFVYPDEIGREWTYEFSPPGYIGGSNNEMEIKACTISLNIARKNSLFTNFRNIVVFTDSAFLKDYSAYAE